MISVILLKSPTTLKNNLRYINQIVIFLQTSSISSLKSTIFAYTSNFVKMCSMYGSNVTISLKCLTRAYFNSSINKSDYFNYLLYECYSMQLKSRHITMHQIGPTIFFLERSCTEILNCQSHRRDVLSFNNYTPPPHV